MDKKKAESTGIKMQIPQGTNEAVAVDELVNDLLHGNMGGALKALHEPHREAETPREDKTKK